MNMPFNPLVFAASFADFSIDPSSVEVNGDKVSFSLNLDFDKDVFVTGAVTAKTKTGYFCYLPNGCISPEDEEEQEYESLEVSNMSICRVAESEGAEVALNQPFVLTYRQASDLSDLIDSICKDRFERELDPYALGVDLLLEPEQGYTAPACPDFKLLQSHKA